MQQIQKNRDLELATTHMNICLDIMLLQKDEMANLEELAELYNIKEKIEIEMERIEKNETLRIN